MILDLWPLFDHNSKIITVLVHCLEFRSMLLAEVGDRLDLDAHVRMSEADDDGRASRRGAADAAGVDLVERGEQRGGGEGGVYLDHLGEAGAGRAQAPLPLVEAGGRPRG